jgi:hypothetical protein
MDLAIPCVLMIVSGVLYGCDRMTTGAHPDLATDEYVLPCCGSQCQLAEAVWYYRTRYLVQHTQRTIGCSLKSALA